MNKEYKFGFLHYWNYFKINYIISLKSLFEYKINIYLSLLNVLFWDLVFLLFGYIFQDFLKLVGWNYIDFILFLLLIYIISNLAWNFIEIKPLDFLLMSGKLNKYLFIPGNRFLNYFLRIEFNSIFISLGNVLIFIPFLLIYGDYTFKYIILIGIIYLICLISHCFILQLINVINFYYFKLSKSIFEIFFYLENINQSYTPLFFEKSVLKLSLFLFYTYFVAKLIIPLFKGIFPINFWFYFSMLILITIFLIVSTLILWHFGLKKYEGYN